MVVYFLFIFLEVLIHMRVKNLADRLKAIKLILLWLYAFIRFPNRAGAHLALF
jgi:hypothetical protein